MEDSGNIIGFIIVASALFSLMNIMLIIKIWFITSDVAKIKNLLEEWLDLEHPKIEDDEKN